MTKTLLIILSHYGANHIITRWEVRLFTVQYFILHKEHRIGVQELASITEAIILGTEGYFAWRRICQIELEVANRYDIYEDGNELWVHFGADRQDDGGRHEVVNS